MDSVWLSNPLIPGLCSGIGGGHGGSRSIPLSAECESSTVIPSTPLHTDSHASIHGQPHTHTHTHSLIHQHILYVYPRGICDCFMVCIHHSLGACIAFSFYLLNLYLRFYTSSSQILPLLLKSCFFSHYYHFEKACSCREVPILFQAFSLKRFTFSNSFCVSKIVVVYANKQR